MDRLSGFKHLSWWMLCIAGGGILLLAHVWFSLWSLAFIALCPLVVTAQTRRMREAFLGGLLTIAPTLIAVGFFLFLGDERSWKIWLFLGFIVTLIVEWGVIGCLVNKLSKVSGASVYWLVPIAVWGMEVLRSRAHTLAPFFGPYFSLGLTQVSPGNPLFQVADLVGVSGLSGVVVGSNLMLVALLRNQRPWYPQFAVALVLVFLLSYGICRSHSHGCGKPYCVAVVQANNDGEGGGVRTYAGYSPVKRRYTDLSIMARSQGADLIAWPEQAVPFAVRTYDPITHWLTDLATRLGVVLLIGGNDSRHDPKGGWKNSNSTFLFVPGKGLEQTHDKEFTAPLETRRFLGPLAAFREKWGVLGAGAGREMLLTVSGVRFANPICFEAVLSEPVRESVRAGAQFIIISGNDAAIGVERGRFFSLRLHMGRSVENRRWLCRADNCGFTGFLSPQGQLVGMNAAGRAAVQVENIELLGDQSVFTRFGDWLEALSVLAAVVVPIVGFMPRVHQ